MVALLLASLSSLDSTEMMAEAWEAVVVWKDISGHLPLSLLQQALGEEKV